MIQDTFTSFWDLATSHPASGCQKLPLKCYHDDIHSDENLWYRSFFPEYRVMKSHELVAGTTLGYELMTLTINPAIYLPWLLERLRGQGLVVQRRFVHSIESARKLTGARIVVNATGMGAARFDPAEADRIMLVRGQTVFVPAPEFQHVVMRFGSEYTYAIPRAGSGGVILGGIRQEHNSDSAADEGIRKDIIRRVNRLTYGAFQHVDVASTGTKDIVGFRPGRKGGPRVERVGDLVHAYGFDGEGYVYAVGAAEVVCTLVQRVTQVARL